MKKAVFLLIIASCFLKLVFAQAKNPDKKLHPTAKANQFSLGAALPLGNFSKTHVTGIDFDYSWSNHRFGQMDIKPVKPVGFISNAGATYYFGKKETVSGYSYDYPGYLFLHIYGGVIYSPRKNGNINLILGPALGLYHGNTQFNIGSKLEGTYYIKQRIGISPAILMMKENHSDPLWAASIKISYCF